MRRQGQREIRTGWSASFVFDWADIPTIDDATMAAAGPHGPTRLRSTFGQSNTRRSLFPAHADGAGGGIGNAEARGFRSHWPSIGV